MENVKLKIMVWAFAHIFNDSRREYHNFQLSIFNYQLRLRRFKLQFTIQAGRCRGGGIRRQMVGCIRMKNMLSSGEKHNFLEDSDCCKNDQMDRR